MPFTVLLVMPPTLRISPSPGNEPPVMLTSAPSSSVSSTSDRVASGASTTAGAFSVYAADGSTVMTGASFVAVTLITAAARLLSFAPSLTTTSMRRSPGTGSLLVLL